MAAATAAVGLNYNESNSRGVCRIAIVIIISSLTTLMYTHVHTCTRMHAYTRKCMYSHTCTTCTCMYICMYCTCVLTISLE